MSRGRPKKVKEIAQELGLSVSAVLGLLRELGYDVRNASSKVNKEMEQALLKKVEEARADTAEGLKRKKRILGVEEAKKPEERRPEPRRHRRSFQRGRYSGEKRRAQKKQKAARRAEAAEVEEERVLELPGPVTVGELASMMGQTAGSLIVKLLNMGLVATVNQTLDKDTIELVAAEYGYSVNWVEPEPEAEAAEELEAEAEPRPPVVAILGHVDHGKTTLLDYIRKTNVAAREHGGITQHIGAYQAEHEGYKITFIDTPGHAAFTALRARGAQGADIVILVVAANEGVKEQTLEALSHAKAAGVPIIVAITKIDLPNANPEMVKRQLAEQGLIPEEWGGDTIFVPVSGKTGEGVDLLLESILLKAEELGLKAPKDAPAEAVVLEAKVEKGRGPVASVIVQKGTLRVGDPFVVGTVYGKVRALYDERGQRLKEAVPSQPVLVQGLEGVPLPGDILKVVGSEKEAREIAEERAAKKKQQIARGEMALLVERIEERMRAGEKKTLPLVIKADAHGSVEALSDTLSKLSDEDVEVKVVLANVGVVTEADVMLAEAVGGMVIGFNTSVDSRARQAAKSSGVLVKTYNVIYDVIDDIKKILEGMVEPEFEEVHLGTAEVKKVFRVSGGRVAGCLVTEGVVRRGARARLKRDGEVVWEGRIASLRRFQDDVEEVQEGLECGVRLEKFDKIKEGDLIECFELREVKR